MFIRLNSLQVYYTTYIVYSKGSITFKKYGMSDVPITIEMELIHSISSSNPDA